MNRESQFLSYDDFMTQLTEFCHVKSTGTMFIVTDIGHSARVSMQNGHIICFAYRLHRGMDALPEMHEIHSGTYHFSDGLLNTYSRLELPETPILLQQLKDRSYCPPGIKPGINKADLPTLSNKSEGHKPVDQSLDSSLPVMAAHQVTTIINQIGTFLMDYLGPFGDIAIQDYLTSNHQPQNKAQFMTMIRTLAAEIDEQKDQLKFKENSIKLL